MTPPDDDAVAASDLEALLLVQERDRAIDRLRHRRETLPERDALRARSQELSGCEEEAGHVRRARDEMLAEERRLDDQSRAIGTHAAEVESRLYSGSVTSPRELQALQADVDMLKRQRSDVEDRELEVMERREELDGRLGDLEARIAELGLEVQRLRDDLAVVEAEIDAAIDSEVAARSDDAAALPAALLRDYEQRRARNRGAGAARLVGVTCQACHLSIPSTEAERIRRARGEQVAYCDNCGAILVP